MKPTEQGPRPMRLKFMGHDKIKHLKPFKIYDVIQYPGFYGNRVLITDERGERASYHVKWFEPVTGEE